jgi:glyoxylase-like metal-dependent hydrolase (beta-lactamase superfamily II)
MTQQDPLAEPEVKEVADRVWVRQAIDNISWFDLGERAVIVDAGEEAPGLASAVLQDLHNTLGDTQVAFLLNTHTHYDHIGLNDVFCHEYDLDVIDGRDAEVQSGEGRWFEGSRRRVRMFPAGGVHTDEDCCIHLPQNSVLFVGDLFGWGLVPANGDLTPKSVERLLNIYQRLIDLQAETVIPGHGPSCTTAHLERWVAYFRWLCEATVEGVDKGHSDEEIMAQISPPEDMGDWWRFLDWKHENSTEKVLRLARSGWAGLDT